MNYNWNEIDINNLVLRKREKWTLIWLQVAIKNPKYLHYSELYIVSEDSMRFLTFLFVELYFEACIIGSYHKIGSFRDCYPKNYLKGLI